MSLGDVTKCPTYRDTTGIEQIWLFLLPAVETGVAERHHSVTDRSFDHITVRGKSRTLEDLSIFGISENIPNVAYCQHVAFARAYSSSPAGHLLPFGKENDFGKGLPLSRGIRYG